MAWPIRRAIAGGCAAARRAGSAASGGRTARAAPIWWSRKSWRRRAPAGRLGRGRHQRLRLHGRGERAAARRARRGAIDGDCGTRQRPPGRFRDRGDAARRESCRAASPLSSRPCVAALAPIARQMLETRDSRAPRSAARWWRCSRISRSIALWRRQRDRTGFRAGGRGSESDGAAADRRTLDTAGALAWRRSATPEAAVRFQQLSAPVAARRSRTPPSIAMACCCRATRSVPTSRRFGIGAAEFHAAIGSGARIFRDAMLATATHDHKRGEDVRARLAVLSEIAGEWESAVRHWLALNSRHRRNGDRPMPSPGDEAMLYADDRRCLAG